MGSSIAGDLDGSSSEGGVVPCAKDMQTTELLVLQGWELKGLVRHIQSLIFCDFTSPEGLVCCLARLGMRYRHVGML
jgi:hypothetical protein